MRACVCVCVVANMSIREYGLACGYFGKRVKRVWMRTIHVRVS